MDTIHDQSKYIIFEYKANEKSFKVHRKLPFENLLHVIRVNFDLPDDAALVLFDPITKCCIAPLVTSDLWTWTDHEVPKYRVIVRNETTQTPVENDGWFQWNIYNCILKLLKTRILYQ